ncbi:MAG: histone deacetylase family protein [Gammaproteobacteria bacterium]
MQTIYSNAHRLHDVPVELNRGQTVPSFENPGRADAVLSALGQAGLGPLGLASEFSIEHAFAVHDGDLVRFLRDAHDESQALGRTGLLQPVCAPGRALRTDRIPVSLDGRLSYYCFDNCTSIAAGTWSAVKASLDVALTAAEVIASRRDDAAFGLCRPPGHHAGRSSYGGYCFLNNAAVAAEYLRKRGAERVTVLDVDYHHGNGTQDIFYERADVQFVSIHADPATDYPYFLGYADEQGIGAGLGCNHNLPLPRGADWSTWSAALDVACAHIEQFGPDALVVSLGVDTYKNDPLASFTLETTDYLRVGARIARLRRPTLFLLEGGYAVDAIGVNVANVLRGHAGGTAPRA